LSFLSITAFEILRGKNIIKYPRHKPSGWVFTRTLQNWRIQSMKRTFLAELSASTT